MSPDGARGLVVDYKTGRPKKGLLDDSLAGGRSLQLAVYVLAARQLLPEVRRWTAVYEHVSTQRQGPVRRTWDEGEGSCHLGQLVEAAEHIARGVEHGLFLQEPSSCRGCDFRTACPVVDQIAPRKAADPRRAPYDALRGMP